MDGPSFASDRERELAELRERAYGPHPDIQDDSVALSRLRELEEAHTRPRDPTDTDGAAAAVAGSGSQPASANRVSTADGHAADSVRVTGASPVDDPLHLSSDSRLAWPRLAPMQYRLVLLAACAVVIVLALAFGVTWFVQPHPDAMLRPTETSADDERTLYAGALGELDSTTVRAFESYRGIEPFVGMNARGWTCLIAINRENRILFGMNCPPPGADPFIEIPVLANRDDYFENVFPEGTVIRLTLHNDRVNVLLHQAPQGD